MIALAFLYTIIVLIYFDVLNANLYYAVIEYNKIDYSSVVWLLMLALIPIINLGVLAYFFVRKGEDYEIYLKYGFLTNLFRR